MRVVQIKKMTFIITILLFMIFNLFLSIFFNVQDRIGKIENQYFFTVDLKKNTTDLEKNSLEEKILKMDSIRQVRYVSKDEAFNKLQKELDVAIPKSENPLSDSMIVYFTDIDRIEDIQSELEKDSSIKEVFLDAEYVDYLKREIFFYKTVGVTTLVVGLFPVLAMLYLLFKTAVSIDYMNNIFYISDDKQNEKRAKKVNLLPFTVGSIIATLIYFNLYLYFRNYLLGIDKNYLILNVREIAGKSTLVLVFINAIIWLIPEKISKITGEKN